MDYEKAYKEALERAKYVLHTAETAGCAMHKDLLTEIFPELAESEDERIRKWLADYFSSIKKTVWIHRDITCEQILEWLEKQKEQKEELVYRLNGLMQDYIKEGKDDEEKEHRLKCYQLFWDALEDTNFFEQKEQKPAEWSEEDEDRIRQIERIAQQAGCTQKLQEEIHDWLKSLRPSWKPSEEQLNALNFAITYFMHETNYKNPTELRDLYDELLKLKQP